LLPKIKLFDKLLLETNARALTLDLWTSCTDKSYLGMTIHYLDINFLPIKIIPIPKIFSWSHSAINILNTVKEELQKWKINITAITSDNALKMLAAFKKEELTHLGHVAHTLNLSVQKGLSACKIILVKVRKCSKHCKFFGS